jgi:hypothetical protein
VRLIFECGQRQAPSHQSPMLVHHLVHLAVEQDSSIKARTLVAGFRRGDGDVGGSVVGESVVPFGLLMEAVDAGKVIEEDPARQRRAWRGAEQVTSSPLR